MMFSSSTRQGIGIAVLSLVVPVAAHAVPVFSTGAVVGTPTHVATFDGLVSGFGPALAGYQENGIALDSPGTSFAGFAAFKPGDSRTTGFYYGAGGNNGAVTISLVGGGTIHALDLLLGDGFDTLGSLTTNLLWETFDGATSTGFGDVVVGRGTTVGWTDTAGFTSIRVAASHLNITAFGNFQAVAVDDVRIGREGVVVPAPEPTGLALFGLAIAGVALQERQGRKRR